MHRGYRDFPLVFYLLPNSSCLSWVAGLTLTHRVQHPFSRKPTQKHIIISWKQKIVLLPCWLTTFQLLLPFCQDCLLSLRLWLFRKNGFILLFSGSFTFQRGLKSCQLYIRCCFPFGIRLQNVLTALMCHITCTKPWALRPLSCADWRGFFSLRLWSQTRKENYKRWSTYPELLFSGAAAHVLNSIVTRQRLTGLELGLGSFSRGDDSG